MPRNNHLIYKRNLKKNLMILIYVSKLRKISKNQWDYKTNRFMKRKERSEIGRKRMDKEEVGRRYIIVERIGITQ